MLRISLLLAQCAFLACSSSPVPKAAQPQPAAPTAAEAPRRPRSTGSIEPAGRLHGIVAAHNKHRATHCAPPLTYSRELAEVAQRWADRLRNANCAFDHNPSTRYGENLAMFSPVGSGSAAQATHGWYSEVHSYSFARPGFTMKTGHFTQVVWRDTTAVGCGFATCRNAEIWVCNYDPPGNVQGGYRANVLPHSCR